MYYTYYGVCIHTASYQFDYEVGDLLQQHHQSGWLSEVLGMSPDQGDGMEQGWKLLLQFTILTLLHLLQLGTKRFQVHAEGDGRGGRAEGGRGRKERGVKSIPATSTATHTHTRVITYVHVYAHTHLEMHTQSHILCV